MARRSLLLCVALILSPAAAPAQRGAPNPIKVLDQWLAAYQRDQLDLTGAKRRLRSRRGTNRAKDFVTVTSGLVPEHQLQELTHERELRILCDKIVEMQDADATKALLEVAAIGLDKRRYEIDRKSVVVRSIGEEYVARLTTPDALAQLVDVASSSGTSAVKAAALRALGARADETYRPHLEGSLQSTALPIQLAAAEGLSRSGLMTAVPEIADHLLRERDPVVITALVDALTAIVAKNAGRLDQSALRRAATTVVGLLGKHDWQVDVAALDFLAPLRMADTIPALFDVLERYAGTEEKMPSDMSGVVRQRAYDLLVSLSSAFFGIDAIDDWRAWWRQQGDDFRVAPEKTSAAPAEAATVSRFFGIPVLGSRVVFVTDVSGSMAWKWSPTETKLAVAKRELKNAVERLPVNASFNLVTFADNEWLWRPGMVTASPKNKAEFFTYVDGMYVGQATNVWAGLQAALELKWIAHGSRYAANVDEVFVLSDGAPTSGDLSNPEDILKTINETNRASKVRIHTVYIETDENENRGRGRGRGGQPNWGMSGAELMQRLAEDNGGQYLRPPRK